MYSQQIVDQFSYAAALLAPESEVINDMIGYAQAYPGLLEFVEYAIPPGPDNNQVQKKIQATRNAVKSHVDKLLATRSPRQFFRKVQDLLETITPMAPSSSWVKIVEAIAAFQDSLDRYLLQQNHANAVHLVMTSWTSSKCIEGFREFFQNFAGALSSKQPPDSQAALALSLAGGESLSDFVDRVQAFNDGFVGLCRLMKLDPTLNVLKIETGSFWLHVSGEPGAIHAYANVIASAVRYVFRQVVFGAIDEKIENLHKVVALRDAYREAGIDTSAADPTIEQGLAAIARNVVDMIGDKPEQIVLNDKPVVDVQADIAGYLGDLTRPQPVKLKNLEHKNGGEGATSTDEDSSEAKT